MRVLVTIAVMLYIVAAGVGARAGSGAADALKVWPGAYVKSTSGVEALRAYHRETYRARMADVKDEPFPVRGTLAVGNRTFSLVTQSCAPDRRTALAQIPGYGTAVIELEAPSARRDTGLFIYIKDGRYYHDFYDAASGARLHGERLFDTLLAVAKKRSQKELITWVAEHSWRWTIRLECAK